MSTVIKLNYIFPKPYAQLYLDNIRAKRREQVRKRQTIKNVIATIDKDGTVEDARKILKCILKSNHIELQNHLESKQYVDVLISTRLEVHVNAKAKKTRGQKNDINVVAKISFVHLAVIERKTKCLTVILDALSHYKLNLSDIMNSIIVVLENYHEVKKDRFDMEVNQYRITKALFSF